MSTKGTQLDVGEAGLIVISAENVLPLRSNVEASPSEEGGEEESAESEESEESEESDEDSDDEENDEDDEDDEDDEQEEDAF